MPKPLPAVALLALVATPALAAPETAPPPALEAAETPAWGPRVEWTREGPPAREHASVFTFGDRVVVYAGSGYHPQLSPLRDAWAYDTGTHEWTELAVTGDVPTPGGSKRVAQAPGSDEAYIFGGYGEGFRPQQGMHRVELRDGELHFTKIFQANEPPSRALHAFAHDPETGRFIVTLGASNVGSRPGTWVGEMDDDVVFWHQIETPGGPSTRFGFAYGFDTDRGELVIFSGQLQPTPEDPMRMTDELWTLDCRAEVPAWSRVELKHAPAGRRNPCFAFDDEHDRLLVWCGTADARTNVPGLVWIERSEDGAWRVTPASDEGLPPRRSSGFGFADPRSDAIAVGFGNAGGTTFTDWVSIHPPAEGED